MSWSRDPKGEAVGRRMWTREVVQGDFICKY